MSMQSRRILISMALAAAGPALLVQDDVTVRTFDMRLPRGVPDIDDGYARKQKACYQNSGPSRKRGKGKCCRW